MKTTPRVMAMDHGQQGRVQCKTISLGGSSALFDMRCIQVRLTRRIVHQTAWGGLGIKNRCRLFLPQSWLILVTLE